MSEVRFKTLVHCRQKFRSDAIYRLDDHGGFQVVYLFTGDCPHKNCQKMAVGHVQIDIFGEIKTTDGFQMADKKLSQQYRDSIKSGVAVRVKEFERKKPIKPTKGCVAGIGEYTSRIGKNNSWIYILKIERIRNQHRFKKLKQI